VLLSVADNGMGMPGHALEEVFAPFRRLPQAKGRPGSGIGLATCKKIAEQHRGRIWVESEPGQGSTFFIELQASSGSSRSEPGEGRLRALLVDDQSDASHAVARILEKHGILVFPAADADEAESLLEREQFDALVVDLTLADGGAMKLIRRVRERAPGAAILAVTAGDGRSAPGPLLAEARRHGAHHVLPKPLDGPQVAKILRVMVSEMTARSPAV
jgi:CheY-like chemotaxis protein